MQPFDFSTLGLDPARLVGTANTHFRDPPEDRPWLERGLVVLKAYAQEHNLSCRALGALLG